MKRINNVVNLNFSRYFRIYDRSIILTFLNITKIPFNQKNIFQLIEKC